MLGLFCNEFYFFKKTLRIKRCLAFWILLLDSFMFEAFQDTSTYRNLLNKLFNIQQLSTILKIWGILN